MDRFSALPVADQRWWLDDAEERQRLFPDTFELPQRAEREALEAGQIVKLIFRFEPPRGRSEAERMWVKVTARDGDGYVGTLDNDPLLIESLQADDEVHFGPEHVIQVFDPSLLGR